MGKLIEVTLFVAGAYFLITVMLGGVHLVVLDSVLHGIAGK